jgi:hypothetical protein
MMSAAEVLISSSTAPIRYCNKVDGVSVGGGAPELVAKLTDWVENEFIEATN